MDDISVGFEHVDLLNGLDGLDVELLQGSLQLLVVCACALVDLLDLSSWRAFSTVHSTVSIAPYALALVSSSLAHFAYSRSPIVNRDDLIRTLCKMLAVFPSLRQPEAWEH